MEISTVEAIQNKGKQGTEISNTCLKLTLLSFLILLTGDLVHFSAKKKVVSSVVMTE